jgi:hypothetical protein
MQLTMLGLPRMGLSGPIGPLTYYMPQLTMLDLSSNQLTGIIPPDLSSYSGLRQLNLANNTLYGGLRLFLQTGMFGVTPWHISSYQWWLHVHFCTNCDVQQR